MSLLVAVIGVLMYLIATRAEVKEIGRIAYAMGLLSFLLKASEKVFAIP